MGEWKIQTAGDNGKQIQPGLFLAIEKISNLMVKHMESTHSLGYSISKYAEL